MRGIREVSSDIGRIPFSGSYSIYSTTKESRMLISRHYIDLEPHSRKGVSFDIARISHRKLRRIDRNPFGVRLYS